MVATRTSTSQTLDRGLRVLEAIATAGDAPRIDELASHLDVHRSIAYRIVRTLELHHLVWRDDGGRCHPGDKLAEWARAGRQSLEVVARPELAAMAEELGMTTFMVVRMGTEAVTLDSVEPRLTGAHVAYRPGLRHPIDRGAPGLAILAGLPPTPGERPEVGEARRRGWAYSAGEVLPGLAAVATWIDATEYGVVSIACVFLGGIEVDLPAVAARVRRGAEEIAIRLAAPVPHAAAASPAVPQGSTVRNTPTRGTT